MYRKEKYCLGGEGQLLLLRESPMVQRNYYKLDVWLWQIKITERQHREWWASDMKVSKQDHVIELLFPLHSTSSLQQDAQMNKWDILPGWPCEELAIHPGGEDILHISC